MKNKKNAAGTIYYLCAVVWYLLAMFYFLARHQSSLGVIYLSIGSMFLCIGSVWVIKSKKAEETINYYKEHAQEFVDRTKDTDMSSVMNKFLDKMPEGGLVLDLGCGSGRDSATMKAVGLQVVSWDACQELADIAKEINDVDVEIHRFEDLEGEVAETYDGIWACASLLHVPREDQPQILEFIRNAIKLDGYFYASYKYGSKEEDRDGRNFTDMNEDLFNKAIKGVKGLEVQEMWVSSDMREDYSELKWLNVICKRTK